MDLYNLLHVTRGLHARRKFELDSSTLTHVSRIQHSLLEVTLAARWGVGWWPLGHVNNWLGATGKWGLTQGVCVWEGGRRQGFNTGGPRLGSPKYPPPNTHTLPGLLLPSI